MTSTRTVRTAVVGALLLLLGLTACGGGSGTSHQQTPRQALATAKRHFDRARSVHLTLSTASAPRSGDAVLGADGTLTHQPAFRGTVKVLLGGFTADVPVVSVDHKVHAKLPLTPGYAVIDPAEYSAPDPADFADPQRGVSELLLDVRGPKRTGQKRHGAAVLTTYSGTLPGARVAPIIPSADRTASYATLIGIDQRGRLATLAVTGHFFSGSDHTTYDLAFDSYDQPVTVAAP
jgi:lipoprotein LprG